MIANYPAADQAEWDALMARPCIGVPIPSGTASKVLVSRPCIFVGYSLRETTGLAPAQVEFLDGTDANGILQAEQSILAPLTGFGGFAEVDVDASAAAAASANNVTLAGAAGATTFITGFEITGDGATAAGDVTVTVTGILGGTKTYHLAIPTVVAPSNVSLIVQYSRPIPALALNTAIVVNVPSFGAGNTFAAVTAHGFQRTVGATGAALGQSVTIGMDDSGPLCKAGVFMRVVTGSVVGAIWVKV